jgi:hypothetical protein
MMAVIGKLEYGRGMSQSLEKRVADLEKQVAELASRSLTADRKKDPTRVFGIFRDDPEFDEAMRLGREYRQAQTCERESAGT